MFPAQALVSHLLTGAYVHPQAHCLVASSPGQSLLVKLFSQSKLPQVAVELVSKCGTSQFIFHKSQTLTQPLSSWKAWLLHAARNRKVSNPIPTTGRNVHWGGQAEIAHSNTICSSVHTYTLRLDSVPPCFLFLLLYHSHRNVFYFWPSSAHSASRLHFSSFWFLFFVGFLFVILKSLFIHSTVVVSTQNILTRIHRLRIANYTSQESLAGMAAGHHPMWPSNEKCNTVTNHLFQCS